MGSIRLLHGSASAGDGDRSSARRQWATSDRRKRAIAEALERRTLLTAAAIPIVDPNFDQFHEPGTTSSASLPPGTYTYDYQYAVAPGAPTSAAIPASYSGVGTRAPVLIRGGNNIPDPINTKSTGTATTVPTFQPGTAYSANYSSGDVVYQPDSGPASDQTHWVTVNGQKVYVPHGAPPNNYISIPGWSAPLFPASFAGITTSTAFNAMNNGAVVPYGSVDFNGNPITLADGSKATGYNGAAGAPVPADFLYLLGPNALHYNGNSHEIPNTLGYGPLFQEVSQTLTTTLASDTVYTLSVEVGVPTLVAGAAATAPALIGLSIDGQLLTPTLSEQPPTPAGEFTTWTETYVTGAVSPGSPITIVLGQQPNSTWKEIDFGDVSLTAQPIAQTHLTVSSINAADITTAGVTSQSVAVTYVPSAGASLVLGSLGTGNLAVTSSTGTSLAVSSATPVVNGDGSVTVTYIVAPPASETAFTSADNNVYTISVLPGSVTDSAGLTTDSSASTHSSFSVNVPGSVAGPLGTAASLSHDVTEATVTLANQDIILVGRYWQQGWSANTVPISQAFVERLLPDGTVDTTFGAGGIITVPQITPSNDAFYGVALESDGSIDAVGNRNGEVMVARYTAAGLPDTSLGGPKVVSPGVEVFPNGVSTALAAGAYAMAVTPDDKMVIGGSDTQGNFNVIVLNHDGSVDTSFNAGVANNSLDPVAGSKIPADPDFTSGGQLKFNPGYQGNVIDSLLIEPITGGGYAIVVAGSSAGTVALARVTSAGALDATFGGDLIPLTRGTANLPGFELIYELAPEHLNAVAVDQPIGVTLESDGSVLVAAGTQKYQYGADANKNPLFYIPANGSDFGLAKLIPSGVLDTTFNPSGTEPGVVTTDINGGEDFANSVVINPSNQQIVVTGTSYNAAATASEPAGLQTAIAVYSSGGALSTGFGAGGIEEFSANISLTRAVDTRAGNPGQVSTTPVDPKTQTIGVITTNPSPGSGSTITRIPLGGTDSAPAITLEPTNQTVAGGATVTFTAAASGTPTPTVQWIVSTNGGTSWFNIAGANSASFSMMASSAQNGYLFEAVFSNSLGFAQTTPATLRVTGGLPTVTLNPVSLTVAAGASVTFTASATGNPPPTVQWIVSVDGGTNWFTVAGATSPSFTMTAAASQNGYILEAVFSNSAGYVLSAGATLTVATRPVVTANPSNQTVSAGSIATFTAAASATPAPAVQWIVSTDGGTNWFNIAGANSPTYSLVVSLAQSGFLFEAVFFNSAGYALTSSASLAVGAFTAPTITANPSNQTVAAGSIATFTAAADGAPTPNVQWIVSTDGGSTWFDIAGATSPTYSLVAAASQNGYYIQAVFINSAGFAQSTAALLTVT